MKYKMEEDVLIRSYHNQANHLLNAETASGFDNSKNILKYHKTKIINYNQENTKYVVIISPKFNITACCWVLYSKWINRPVNNIYEKYKNEYVGFVEEDYITPIKTYCNICEKQK